MQNDKSNNIFRPGIMAWILGWLVTSVFFTALVSMISTQYNVLSLLQKNLRPSTYDYLSTMGMDLVNFAPIFLVIGLLGLLIAFLVGEMLYHLMKLPRWLPLTLAGAAAIITILSLIPLVAFGMQPIGAARATSGYILLIVIGAFSGWFFHALSKRLTKTA